MSHRALVSLAYPTTALAQMQGEAWTIVFDSTKVTAVVMDGSTPGGIPLSRADHTHVDATDDADGFMSSTDHHYLYNHGHASATDATPGFMSAQDKTKLDGIPVGGGQTQAPASVASQPNTLALRDANGDSNFNTLFAGEFVGHFQGNLQGNADTVTNGVYSNQVYNNPSWIGSLAASKLTGAIVATSVAWTNVTGRPTDLAQFTNGPGYITQTSDILGFSGGVTGMTSAPSPSRVVIRDQAGRAQVVDPSQPADIATKNYVDQHIPPGQVGAIANSLMQRDAAGRSQVVAPAQPADIVNRGFLDNVKLFVGGGPPSNPAVNYTIWIDTSSVG